MDFNKTPIAPVTPIFRAEHEGPAADDLSAGSDFWVWKNVIGPSDGGSTPSAPNPMDITGPGLDLLAARLHWRT